MSVLPTSDMRPLCPSTTMSCVTGDRTIASRPKLTLQTAALPRTFGSSSTGLSLPFTAAGASPTVRNTFKNAYDVPSPSSATSSPKGSSHRLNVKPMPPLFHSNQSTPNLNQNTHSSHRPYQQPLGVRSILRNSPLDTASRRRSGSVSAGASGPASAGVRRVFFPAKKQVSYRSQLEEEIRTVHYTAQHIDLIADDEAVQDKAVAEPQAPPADPTEDDSDTDSSLSVSESSTSEDASADETAKNTSLSKIERKRRRSIRAERQVRAVALLDGLDSDAYASNTPPTPHQGRAKRRREWKWTLGPLDTSPVSLASSTTTPESLSASSACTVDEVRSDAQKCPL